MKKKITKHVMLMLLMALCILAPSGGILPSGTLTAQAASKTAVKNLTVGKTYTIKGYAKVTSSKKSVATASKKSSKEYTVKAKKKGTTTIRCYNAKGKLVKTIYLIATKSSSFKYDTKAVTLEPYEQITLTATVPKGCTVEYTSSKPSVAVTFDTGKIIAYKTGTATVSAKVYYKGKLIKTLSKKVTVAWDDDSYNYNSSDTEGNDDDDEKSTIPELSVTYDTSAVTVSPGRSVTAKATVTSGYKAAYSSSDTSVATVDSSGCITGQKGGTATITVTVSYGNTVYKTLTKAVTVRSYSLPATLSFDRGATTELACTLADGTYDSGDTFTWSSSDVSVASITSYTNPCTLKGAMFGTATVTCTVNNKVSFTCAVTVNKVFMTRANGANTTLSGGQMGRVSVWYETASDVVTFGLSNSNIQIKVTDNPSAEYDSASGMNGFCIGINFTAMKQGTCNVYVYINDNLFATIPVTVTSTYERYYTYQAWKENLKQELWTDDMTDLQKIVCFGDYVFGSQPYSEEHSSCYSYAYNTGGDCWAAADLLIDLAEDLGYEAEGYAPLASSGNYNHMRARIYMGSDVYTMEARYFTSTGMTVVWKNGTGITVEY